MCSNKIEKYVRKGMYVLIKCMFLSSRKLLAVAACLWEQVGQWPTKDFKATVFPYEAIPSFRIQQDTAAFPFPSFTLDLPCAFYITMQGHDPMVLQYGRA